MAAKRRKDGSAKAQSGQAQHVEADHAQSERVKKWNDYKAERLAKASAWERMALQRYFPLHDRMMALDISPCPHGKRYFFECEVCEGEYTALSRRAEGIGFALDHEENPPPTDPVERREWVATVKDDMIASLNDLALSRGELPATLIAENAYVQWCNVELDRLDKIAAELATNSTAPVANGQRIEWHGSTIEFVTIVRNLAKSSYIDLPSKNGKGDGNETELFRRLQQVFIVRNEKGEEITPEGVKNRASGKPIGGAREKQFEFPEATRKKAGKGR